MENKHKLSNIFHHETLLKRCNEHNIRVTEAAVSTHSANAKRIKDKCQHLRMLRVHHFVLNVLKWVWHWWSTTVLDLDSSLNFMGLMLRLVHPCALWVRLGLQHEFMCKVKPYLLCASVSQSKMSRSHFFLGPFSFHSSFSTQQVCTVQRHVDYMLELVWFESRHKHKASSWR